MAKWTRKKIDSNNINNGNEYSVNDVVSIEELNGMVNSGLYAQDFAEKLTQEIDTSEVGNVGTPSVTLVDGVGATADKPYKKFKFANLKGEKGDSAGFGTPSATVDSNVGTPSVIVTASGDDKAKVFSFEFHNLKGEKGDGTIQLEQETGQSTTSGMSQKAITDNLNNRVPKSYLSSNGTSNSISIESASGFKLETTRQTETTEKAFIQSSGSGLFLQSESPTGTSAGTEIAGMVMDSGEVILNAKNVFIYGRNASGQNVYGVALGGENGISFLIEDNIITVPKHDGELALSDGSNLTPADIEALATKCGFERVETVYDKDSADSNINLGYTSGIQNLQSVNIDLSKYKKINVFLNLYDTANTSSGNRNDILQVDLSTNRVNDTSYASNTFGYIHRANDDWHVNVESLFMVRIDYNHVTKLFTPKLAYNGALVTQANYYVYKIEGVY